MTPEKLIHIAIVGRPNVGKSTLLNRIVGEKITITSHKPQTTRHRILGIKTIDAVQMVYIDTPGLQKEPQQALHKYMNRLVSHVVDDVDVVLFVVEALHFNEADAKVVMRLKNTEIPIILAINKIDEVADKTALLPFIESMQKELTFKHIIPLSARKNIGIDTLEKAIADLAPERAHEYAEDDITDRSLRFSVAEVIREKLTRYLNQELPYALSVQIEVYKEKKNSVEIQALIVVNKASQKKIIIGKHGEMLKEIGTKARMDIEKILDKKVFLKLWVKVQEGWANDERHLRELGYDLDGDE
ncbi:MAG: GTPase Era [Gammaproteobacteria bacterium]|nr:GTPase Era [Gammaproteobacteria bacterium]